MIELKNISKDFGSGEKAVHAVRDVSLSIGSGEIFGIIGFSGAGKSTLVRCINLLERPSSGSVFVAGQDLTALSAKDLRAARKKIGMIFQHFNLMPSRTVAGNVAYPLKGSGLSKEDIQKKVATLLELVGIGDKADAYPSQLSGGQKQRVAIARALANDPQVLLCDEATSALDPQTTKAILHLLKHLNETLGITIVLITHEMAVVKEICDRVAVMEYGRVVEQGEVFTVFAEPKQAHHEELHPHDLEPPEGRRAHRRGFPRHASPARRAHRPPVLCSAQRQRADHLRRVADVQRLAQHHFRRYHHRAGFSHRRNGRHHQRREKADHESDRIPDRKKCRSGGHQRCKS